MRDAGFKYARHKDVAARHEDVAASKLATPLPVPLQSVPSQRLQLQQGHVRGQQGRAKLAGLARPLQQGVVAFGQHHRL